MVLSINILRLIAFFSVEEERVDVTNGMDLIG